MKCIFTIFFLLTCHGVFTQGTWTQKAIFGGTSRYSATGFSIGNKGYIGTGMDGTTKKDFWEWDKTTNTWTQKADFGGGARYSAVGFSIGTKGYIGTGMDGTSTRRKDFWEYDPVTNVWTQKADFAGTAREGAVGFSIGSYGYIGTGQESVSTFKQDFWEYNPATNTWIAKANFGGTARTAAVGFSIGTKGYIGTGIDAAGAAKNDFWEWDQATNTWTQKADFGGTARFGATGFAIGTKAYIGVGRDGSLAYKQDFWEWDQASNTWTQTVNFSGSGRNAATSFVIANRAYMGTGFDGTYKKDFWEWNIVPISSVTVIDPLCFGQCNGSAIATVTGGTLPYTYIWSNGQSASVATGLCNGTYTFTLVDADQDSNVITVNVVEPTSLTSSIIASSNVSCFGGSNGTASASATGGTLPYTYIWSNGISASSVSGLIAGNYFVTITDVNGCSSTSTLTITQPSAFFISVLGINVSCNSGNNGSASAVISGGTSPYTYNWSNGLSSSLVTGLSAGTYTITVTDANACSIIDSITITEPPPIVVMTNTVSPICKGSCVTLNASSSGGTGTHSYVWQPGNISGVAITVCPTSNVSYTVTVIDSLNCSGNDTVTVQIKNVPVSFTLNPNTVCETDFAFALTGGDPPGGTYSGPGVSGGIFDPAIAGPGLHTIIYTVTDSGGCTDSATAQILVDVCTGIPTILPHNDEIELYPNPGTDIFFIKTGIHSGQLLSIQLFNTMGEKVIECIVDNQKINLSEIPVGIYFYQITADYQKLSSGKIMVIR